MTLRTRTIVPLALLAGIVLAAGLMAAKPAKSTPAAKVTVAVVGLHCQACPDQLQKDLAKLPGAQQVRATLDPPQVTARLDETKIPAGRFVAAIAGHPQLMDPAKTYGARLLVKVDAAMCAGQQTMCPACAPEITKRLRALKGVTTVTFDKTGREVSVGLAKGATVKTTDIAKALKASSYKFSVTF